MALPSARFVPHRLNSGNVAPRSLLRNKDLDFLILTGCSCLITLLHHPTINHLQTASGSAASSPASSQSSAPRTSQTSLGNYSAVPPKRQSFTIEEEA
ncbi:MAG: hypothetical protein HC824_05640 [Synechococcales cyanobacterium RM1_1_8]|nr:hypothetical protein [Synechococcales cyanobacterium RM1_1_8]